MTGYITLTEVSNCYTQGQNQYLPAYECGVYQLLNNVPLAAKWIYSAGAASLSFLIFAFVANALATWLTYLRRINSLHTLPAFMHRLHGENIMVRRRCVACARAPAACCLAPLFCLSFSSPTSLLFCLRRPPCTHKA